MGSGALGRRNIPLQGVYSSRIKKIAPDTRSAATKKVVTEIVSARENRSQLTKILVIQKIITYRSGGRIVVPVCAIISRRSCATIRSSPAASDGILILAGESSKRVIDFGQQTQRPPGGVPTTAMAVFGHSATGECSEQRSAENQRKIPALLTMEFIFGEHLCIIRD